ncbi:hypothetical protein DOY81_015524, partial [Sarcophaga bullata]
DYKVRKLNNSRQEINMKFIVILTIIGGLVAFCQSAPQNISPEQLAKGKGYFDQCTTQEKLTAEEVAKIRSKNVANPSQNMKCFAACFLEKTGALKDNKLQEDVVLSQFGDILGQEKTKQILDKCKDIKAADRCDMGYKLYQCYEQNK